MVLGSVERWFKDSRSFCSGSSIWGPCSISNGASAAAELLFCDIALHRTLGLAQLTAAGAACSKLAVQRVIELPLPAAAIATVLSWVHSSRAGAPLSCLISSMAISRAYASVRGVIGGYSIVVAGGPPLAAAVQVAGEQY